MKLEFYKYMVEIGLNENNYLDVCKHFLAIFKTPQIQQSDIRKGEVGTERRQKMGQCMALYCLFQVLKCVVFYLLLSTHDNEKWELLHKVNAMRELELMPEHKVGKMPIAF